MRKVLLSCAMLMALCPFAKAQQAEKLDRGVVAVKTDAGVYVSWRSLAEDPAGQTYDVYRDGVKINAEAVTRSTNFVDAAGTADSKYVIKAVDANGGVVEESKETAVWADGYKRIHLDRPAGGTAPDGETYTYSPNDCSVGDVDGDGVF